MSSPTPGSVQDELNTKAFKEDNFLTTVEGASSTVSSLPYVNSESKLQTKPLNPSKPLWVDSNSVPHAGEFPFAVPLHSGVVNTGSSVLDIKGSSTLTANDIYHQVLVEGSQVTTFGSQVYIRVSVTDEAGNITDGDYYIQAGTIV